MSQAREVVRRQPRIFLENLEYFEKRSNIYGYNDDAMRWALLSRGVLEFIRGNKDRWQPDVIVAADWQTGFLCNFLKLPLQRRSHP
jgi:Glycogen synthase